MSDIMTLAEQDINTPESLATDISKLGFDQWNVKMNRTYCLGESGQLVYEAISQEFTKLIDMAVITGLPFAKIKALTWGDITRYTFDDLKKAALACYWDFNYEFDADGYAAELITPSKRYALARTWNHDKDLIDYLVKQRKDNVEPLKYKY